MIFLVFTALAISGCTNNATVQPSTLKVASQLYSLGGIHWYEYSGSGATDNVTITTRTRFEFGDEIYKGLPTVHVRVIANTSVLLNETIFFVNADDNSLDTSLALPPMNASDIVDTYTCKVNDSLLGAHVRSEVFGHVVDHDAPDSELENISRNASELMDQWKSNAQLTYLGQETIVVNGVTYDCDKYSYIINDIPYVVWNTARAPLPVKITYTVKIKVPDNTSMDFTILLQGWG